MNKIQGTGVALVTPFDTKGEVDYSALKKLVNYQVEGGTDFLVVHGTTGEAATLNESEKQKIVELIFEESQKRVPIVLGLSGNNTKAIVEKYKTVDASQVDAFLCASPHYNKPSQKGIVEHFTSIADVAKKPIVLYNVPGRTGSNMSSDTTLKLSEHENIIAVKEASGDMEQVMEIIADSSDDFSVLSGEDALTLPMIACGAKGVISVVANAFPKHFGQMVSAAMKGDFKTARELHYLLLNVTQLFFTEGNPSGVKVSLAHQKIIENELRLPLTSVSQSLREKINEETDRVLSR